MRWLRNFSKVLIKSVNLPHANVNSREMNAWMCISICALKIFLLHQWGRGKKIKGMKQQWHRVECGNIILRFHEEKSITKHEEKKIKEIGKKLELKVLSVFQVMRNSNEWDRERGFQLIKSTKGPIKVSSLDEYRRIDVEYEWQTPRIEEGKERRGGQVRRVLKST